MQIKTTALAVLFLATALSGCGGAGGEGGSLSVPPPPILPDCDPYRLDCPIYNRYISQGLSHEQASERTQTLSIRMINADAAYDRGWTGDGRHDRILRNLEFTQTTPNLTVSSSRTTSRNASPSTAETL